MALQQIDEERSKDSNTLSPNTVEGALTASGSLQRVSNRRSRASTSNATALGTSPELLESGFHQSGNSGSSDRIRRAVSISSLNSLCKYHIFIAQLSVSLMFQIYDLSRYSHAKFGV